MFFLIMDPTHHYRTQRANEAHTLLLHSLLLSRYTGRRISMEAKRSLKHFVLFYPNTLLFESPFLFINGVRQSERRSVKRTKYTIYHSPTMMCSGVHTPEQMRAHSHQGYKRDTPDKASSLILLYRGSTNLALSRYRAPPLDIFCLRRLLGKLFLLLFSVTRASLHPLDAFLLSKTERP